MLTYDFIVFLDTYINLAKYLRRVTLDVSVNWRYLHQDAGKTYSEYEIILEVLKSNHLQA